MSSFWSIWIIVITVATLVAMFYLLRWNTRNYCEVAEGENLHHEFDGISELNNPLPKWWSWLFVLTLVFGILYLILYPGLGNFAGLFGWQSANKNVQSLAQSVSLQGDMTSQYNREVARDEAIFSQVLSEIIYQEDGQTLRPVEELAYNSEALKIGQRLFLQNCAQCHGSDARGSLGFPNLTDGNWQYGGSGEAIVQTLLYGRQGNMPGWTAALGDDGIRDVAAYVLQLSGRKVNQAEAERGQVQFAMCAACHGMDGKGNPAVGAPNLTDGVWLYGGSRQAVEDTLRYGRNGVMPAWKDILGEDKVQLVSAYVWRLSRP